MRNQVLASPWGKLQSFDEALPSEAETEVCIIGAGISGVSVAYGLAKDGVRVLIVDDGPVGGGETGHTTAHLANALDDRFFRLERLHGEDGARLAEASHAAAIDAIETNVRALGIACDFRRVDGYLFAPADGDMDVLDHELGAARRAGLVDVELLPRAPLPFDTGPCIRFPRQATFHPLAYLDALVGEVRKLGGRIHTNAHAVEVSAGKTCQVKCAGGQTIIARWIVDATNAAITLPVAMSLRQAAYRTYAIACAAPPGGFVPDALYWDTADPYHYVRLLSGSGGGGDTLIVGGEDHRTGQDDDPVRHWTNLEVWTRERFLGAGTLSARWSGQILEPADGLAFIGRSPKSDEVLIVTGDSGQGITHGALAGLMIPDIIQGRPNRWEKLYDPRRSPLRGMGALLREVVSSAAQYADWLRPGDVKSIDAIAPGEGAVVRRGLRLTAVYRDEQGLCHERSAICPHLGGVVAWNAAEKSWDCPCHGSRFDCYGTVLNGPAVSDLGSVEDEGECGEERIAPNGA